MVVKSNGYCAKAILAYGCQQSVPRMNMSRKENWQRRKGTVVISMLNGNTTDCCEKTDVNLEIGAQPLVVSCLATPQLVSDYHMILGMDILSSLGGVVIGRDGKVQLICQSGVVNVDASEIGDG